ncbi:acyl carrier protein [Kribbella sp. HUAS MG21]|uniref:Acyl carrier protein n=1 Tax=Kribbella sp. HUAS MG21 TaxID=3160966 RepID=A0AAU7TEB0_9ACTN
MSQVEESPVAGRNVTSDEVTEFLRARVATMVGLPAADVDPTAPLPSIGVDSVHAMELVADLEEWLGIEVPDQLAWSYPTIALISGQLATGSPA